MRASSTNWKHKRGELHEPIQIFTREFPNKDQLC